MVVVKKVDAVVGCQTHGRKEAALTERWVASMVELQHPANPSSLAPSWYRSLREKKQVGVGLVSE